MKRYYVDKFSIFFIFFLIGCNNRPDLKNDREQLTDSIENAKKTSLQNTNESDTFNELKSYIAQYQDSYGKTDIIDSVFLFNGDTVQLSLKHYCTFDRTIDLPKKYISIYGLDSFITHSFSSAIVLKRKGIPILDRVVSKDDFSKFLDSALVKYGVFLYPKVRVLKDEIQIAYSISIPLTDVGIGVETSIDSNGIMTFHEDK